MNNPTTTVSAQSQSDTTDLEEFGPPKLRRRTLPSLSRRRRTPYERNTTQSSSQISLAEISRQRIYYYCTRTATGQQESPPRHPPVRYIQSQSQNKYYDVAIPTSASLSAFITNAPSSTRTRYRSRRRGPAVPRYGIFFHEITITRYCTV